MMLSHVEKRRVGALDGVGRLGRKVVGWDGILLVLLWRKGSCMHWRGERKTMRRVLRGG